MLNFDTLEELNLSSNWFGLEGLYSIKDELKKFKRLKVLKLGTSKLCFDDPADTHNGNKLAEILKNCETVEELDLCWNGMNDLKFECIIESLVGMRSLKRLCISKNSITNVSISKFLRALVKAYSPAKQGEESKIEDGPYIT